MGGGSVSGEVGKPLIGPFGHLLPARRGEGRLMSRGEPSRKRRAALHRRMGGRSQRMNRVVVALFTIAAAASAFAADTTNRYMVIARPQPQGRELGLLPDP